LAFHAAPKQELKAWRPSTIGDLLELVANHLPKRFILDYTIPWGGRVPPEDPMRSLLPQDISRELRGITDTSHLLLMWAASQPSVDSIAAIMPSNVASAPALEWLRRGLLERFRIAAHIELPLSGMRGEPIVRGSFLRFDKVADSAYLTSLTATGDLIEIDNKSWFQSYLSCLEGRRPEHGYAAKLTTTNWTTANNDPEAAAVRERLASLGCCKRLSDLAEIINCGPLLSETDAPPEGEGYEIVDARRLRYQSIGEDPPQSRRVLTVRDERCVLRAGDLLMPSIYHGEPHAFVFSDDSPSVAANSLIIIRPQAEISAWYVAEYLNSSTGRRLLEASTLGTASRLSASSLRDLPVPVFPIDAFSPLTDVADAQSMLLNAADELNSRRASLFDIVRHQQLGDNLTELRRRASMLSDCLRRIGTLDYQISQYYPFPVAYGYRLLNGYVDPRERYQEQLRFAENLLAFLTSVSLALLSDEDRKQLQADICKSWRGGISPGDWLSLLQQSAKLLKRYVDHPLASSLAELDPGQNRRGFGKELVSLVQAKNDFKHDRGPKAEADVVQRSNELRESLEACMTSLGFWTQFPVYRVRELDVERRASSRVRLQCSQIVGDHPGFQQVTRFRAHALTKGDLYVEVNDRLWVSLYPYIHVLTCKHCKMEEHYFLDKWDGQAAMMKSFERGHTTECSDVGEELARQTTS